MKISKGRVLISVVLWLLLMAGLGTLFMWQWLHREHPIPDEHRYLQVAKGESLHSVARRLHQQGLLRWPMVWRLYSRFVQPGSIKVGEYQLAEKESPITILALLQSGSVITYNVTLVEGKTFAEWVDLLSLQPKLQVSLASKPVEEQLVLLGLDIEHPEGWFFPDTYKFVAGDTDISILRRAHARMRELLNTEWPLRQPDLPYESPYEALIMASIIEKETGLRSERGEIAGVFIRRLRLGMRLQTDPTVIYGLGQEFKGNLTRKHLAQLTPYNTYQIKGLPPTPIAMPGAEAVHAALHPEPGTTLYFVAKGDGSHHFSTTLAEHNEAVSRYQRKRIENYRSAPGPQKGAEP
jgi:UPF0755 protein